MQAYAIAVAADARPAMVISKDAAAAGGGYNMPIAALFSPEAISGGCAERSIKTRSPS